MYGILRQMPCRGGSQTRPNEKQGWASQGFFPLPFYLSSRQATPGSSLPSMNSRLAPPPVEIWVILSA